MNKYLKFLMFGVVSVLVSCDEIDDQTLVQDDIIEFTRSNFRVLERDENNQIIGIEFANFKYIPSEVLDTLPNLKWLRLSDIDSLSEELIKLENLESITFDTPKLETLPESISILPRLKKLNFKTSNIESLPSNLTLSNTLESIVYSSYRNPSSLLGDIVSLRNLQELEITIDTVIPIAISNLKSLKSLEINGTFELPIEIGDLVNLEVLHLRSNDLKSIPTTIGKLEKLRFLIIENSGNLENDFDLEIPEELSRCQNLDSIRISVPLNSLPKNIGNLTNLTYLYLYNSGLSNLPNSFTELQSLRYLAIIESEIIALPEITSSFRNMNYFFISSGAIEEIPKGLELMENLKMLSFRGNRISTIPSDIGSLKNVTDLDLRDNLITSIPSNISTLKELLYFFI